MVLNAHKISSSTIETEHNCIKLMNFVLILQRATSNDLEVSTCNAYMLEFDYVL